MFLALSSFIHFHAELWLSWQPKEKSPKPQRLDHRYLARDIYKDCSNYVPKDIAPALWSLYFTQAYIGKT